MSTKLSATMSTKAFTLVELMIVVAIIGILAAIAIPNFVEMQNRAKRAELPANVDGIKTSEMGYEAAFDAYLACQVAPGVSPPGKSPAPWLPNSTFETLGWSPDGEVRGVYEVLTTPASSGPRGGDFRVIGVADVDGDGVYSRYTATKEINSTQISLNDTY